MPSRPALLADIRAGIVKKNGSQFDVARGSMGKILHNQPALMCASRIVPEQENGKVVGIRLFSVAPDSLLGVMGMQEGDRLEKINGTDLATPEAAHSVVATLPTASHVTIALNRRGQEMAIDYNIVP